MLENNKTILVVDDDAELRQGLLSLLEDEGFYLEHADSGETALAIVEKISIDLLITDILMPEMDGIELTLKAKKIQPDLKVILISGGGRQLDNVSQYDYLSVGKKLTATDFILKKPFAPQELIDMVYKVIED